MRRSITIFAFYFWLVSALSLQGRSAARVSQTAAVDGRGQTAVHGAASTSANTVIRYLVEQGASADARDQSGRTPQDLAESTLRPRPLTAALLQELSAHAR